MARVHMKNFVDNPKAEIVGFCDVVVDRAKECKREFGSNNSRFFADAHVMFEECQLDAVYSCVPPYAHGFELEAIERNIPFFVEKPVDIDLKQAERIANAVEKKNLLTSVGYMNRYREGVRMARKLFIHEKPVLTVGGIVDRGICKRAGESQQSWWFRKEKSGGQLHEETSHTFDLARFIVGEVREVHAFAAGEIENVVLPAHSNIQLSSIVNLKFRNESVGSVWSMFLGDGDGEDISLSVYGDKTTALFRNWDHTLQLIERGENHRQFASEQNIFEIEDAAFVDAVATGNKTQIMCPYADGLKTIEITLAANKSIETGKPVSIPA